jgi:hypothetical protein
MTALALRYDTIQDRMDDARTSELRALRERIERGDYDVDPGQVAEAIVVRLLAELNGARSRAIRFPTHQTTPRPPDRA